MYVLPLMLACVMSCLLINEHLIDDLICLDRTQYAESDSDPAMWLLVCMKVCGVWFWRETLRQRLSHDGSSLPQTSQHYRPAVRSLSRSLSLSFTIRKLLRIFSSSFVADEQLMCIFISYNFLLNSLMEVALLHFTDFAKEDTMYFRATPNYTDI